MKRSFSLSVRTKLYVSSLIVTLAVITAVVLYTTTQRQAASGECEKTQVEGAKIGMTQNIGGSGATILTHNLKAE